MKPIYIRLLDICIIIAHPTDTAEMVRGGGGGRDPAGMLTQQAVINVTQHTAERTAWGPGAGMWRGRKNG